MQLTDIPDKLPLPFAAAAGPSYIRSIPTASQIGITPGAASLTDGFPPLNFNPVASGGIPPFGQDMNGILNWVSAWAQWVSAGSPVSFDSTFATAIGGYPRGALLNSLSSVGFWSSLVDDNTTNPDTGGANWQAVAFGTTYPGNPNGFVAGNGVSANGVTQSLLWDTSNGILWICTVTGTAATAVWSGVTGSVASIAIAAANGFIGTSSGGSAPILTLGTSISGMLKGAAGALAAANAVTDFVAPSQFTGSNQLLASPGYQKFPGGLIEQWGLSAPIPSGGFGATISFPIAFPTACLNVTATFSNAAATLSGKDMGCNIASAPTTTGFVLTQQSGAASQYFWRALGY